MAVDLTGRKPEIGQRGGHRAPGMFDGQQKAGAARLPVNRRRIIRAQKSRAVVICQIELH